MDGPWPKLARAGRLVLLVLVSLALLRDAFAFGLDASLGPCTQAVLDVLGVDAR